MLLHPAIKSVAERRDRIDKALRSGKLVTKDSIALTENYAFVYKDGSQPVLALGRSGAARADEADEGEHCIPFVITVFDEDRDGDIVVPKGCQLGSYILNPVVFFGHQAWEIPIATSRSPDGRVAVYPEENLIRAKAYFDSQDSDAMLIYDKVKRGFLNATSMAFVPIEAYRRDQEEKWVGEDKARTHGQPMMPPGWLFKVYDLTEWSVVGVPSNAGAVRDVLDKEKSHMTPRLQKALGQYAAQAKLCFPGWCPQPDGTCAPCEVTKSPLEASQVPKSPYTAVALNEWLSKGGIIVVTTMTKATQYDSRHAGWFSDGSDGLYVRAGGKKNFLGRGGNLVGFKFGPGTSKEVEPMPKKQSVKCACKRKCKCKAAEKAPVKENLQVTNIRGGRGRFDGCTDTDSMRAKLRQGERLEVNTYGGGRQVEVRGNPNPTGAMYDSGSRGIIATAQIVDKTAKAQNQADMESATPKPPDALATPKEQPSSDISPDKACKILQDGTVNGKPLTDDQRKMFGAACSRASKSYNGLRETCKALLESSGGAGGYSVAVDPGTTAEEAGGFKACDLCAGSGNCLECKGGGTVEGRDCQKCKGSGECPDCGGIGQLKKAVKGPKDVYCPACRTYNGTNKKDGDSCPHCGKKLIDPKKGNKMATTKAKKAAKEKPEDVPDPPKSSALVLAKMYHGYKKAGDYAHESLKAMDNPGVADHLQEHMKSHHAKAMQHLKDGLEEHHPDHDMDDLMKGFEVNAGGSEPVATGEENKVDNAEVPPDSTKAFETDPENSGAAPFNKGEELETQDHGAAPFNKDADGQCPECGGQLDENGHCECGYQKSLTDEGNPDETKGEELETQDHGAAPFNKDADPNEKPADADPDTEEILERYQTPKGWATRKLGRVRRTKDGRMYIVRRDLTNEGNPAEMAGGPHGSGEGQIIKSHHLGVIKEAAAHLDDVGSHPDTNSIHKAAHKYHAKALHTVHKDLSDPGQAADATGAGPHQTNEGNPAELKSHDQLPPALNAAYETLLRRARQYGVLKNGNN